MPPYINPLFPGGRGLGLPWRDTLARGYMTLPNQVWARGEGARALLPFRDVVDDVDLFWFRGHATSSLRETRGSFKLTI